MSVTSIATGPGVDVSVVAGAPAGGVSQVGAGAFFIGLAETGPINTPTLITSMAAYRSVFGSRSGAFALLSDSVEAFLGESDGAGSVVVTRAVGPTPTQGAHAFVDLTPATTMTVKALYPGALSANLTVSVVKTSSTFTVDVVDSAVGTGSVEHYGPFSTVAAAVVAINGISPRITVVDAAVGTIPVTASSALSAGTGDEGNITDSQYGTALDANPGNLGVGQVAIPGASTTGRHALVMAHAVAKGRYALLDGADQANSGALQSLAAADGALPGTVKPGDSGTIVDHWFTIPPAPGTTTPRHVPGSAVLAGRIAATDTKYGHSARAAAGPEGQVIYATGLSGAAFDDPTRQTLNGSPGVVGVITCTGVDGTVTGAAPLSVDPTAIHGWRNVSGDPQWYDTAASRERMSLDYRLKQRGKQLEFAPIVPATLADLANLAKTELEADLRAGALDPNAATPPYTVDVGASVNTPTTKANRQIVVTVGFTPVRTGEHVHFNAVVNV